MNKIKKYALLTGLLAFIVGFANVTFADASINFLNSKYSDEKVPRDKVINLVSRYFDAKLYREIKVQIIYDKHTQPEHLLIYLFSKKYHRVDFAKITIDANYQVLSITQNYQLSSEDIDQQLLPEKITCPDPSIEFIAFAPNDDGIEQTYTLDVANAAEQHGLKTIRLLKTNATTKNYLDYMSCPKLKGNFYDGDGYIDSITTADGLIYYSQLKKKMNNQFHFKVTNLWVACQAFNNPMGTTMIDVTQSQKYGAGISDLLIGPSDRAADCAMRLALDHKPMTQSFLQCYRDWDDLSDLWGFAGKGSNYFGA